MNKHPNGCSLHYALSKHTGYGPGTMERKGWTREWLLFMRSYWSRTVIFFQ